MVKKLYLIRHGHIDLGAEKRYLGMTDVPMDALGKDQAYRLQRYFYAIPLDAIFTSPLKRCMETMQIISQGKDTSCQVEEALCEIDMGDWENVAMESIKSEYPALYNQRGEDLENFCPPHGESFHQLAQRVNKVFHRIIASQHNTVAIIAHAGVNRVILASLMGIAIKDLFRIEQSYGCVYEIDVNRVNAEGACQRIL